MESLEQIFLSALGERAKGASSTLELEMLLTERLATARAAWPTLFLPTEAYLTHVASTLSEKDELAATLGLIHWTDLYLTLGCILQDERAIALFEEHCLASLGAVFARAHLPGLTDDDLRQIVRQRLLVREGSARPGIARYAGRGTLKNWVKVVASRLLIDLARQTRSQKKEELASDETLASMAGQGNDPELAYLKGSYRREVQKAFEAAICTLSVRQRNLFRHQLLYGLTLDQIARLYQVHRATVARQLADARQCLVAETHRQLRQRLALSTSDLESLLGLIQSQFEISLRRLLASTENPRQ